MLRLFLGSRQTMEGLRDPVQERERAKYSKFLPASQLTPRELAAAVTSAAKASCEDHTVCGQTPFAYSSQPATIVHRPSHPSWEQQAQILLGTAGHRSALPRSPGMGQPADELSVLLQLSEPPDWDLDKALADAELTLPTFTSCNPQLPLVRDEQRFLDILDSSGGSKSYFTPSTCDLGQHNLVWSDKEGTGTGVEHCREEIHIAVKQRNKQAQRKCRQRKKEREQKVEEQVAGLNTRLRGLESHKLMLQRSNLMLAAAAKEAMHGQEPKGVCIAAESLHNWDPQAMLQLREAWPYAVCLTPAHIVGLTLQELSQLWQDLAAAMVAQLPLAQRHISAAATGKVQALCREAMALCGSMALGNPGVMYDFISHPYMAGNRAVYSALAADLGATPQQCQRVRAVVQEHAATMRQLQASEQQLLSSMQACGTGGADQWPLGQGMQDLLQSICDDAIRVTFHFHSQIWSTCLTPLQLATCIVRSAPSCPDVACIAELLSEQAPSV